MGPGMLWFDNDPKIDLLHKISKAAFYYQDKYGLKPDLCFVHPSVLPGRRQIALDIEIKPNPQIKPDHLWIGISRAL